MAKSHAVADFGERTVGKWINAVTAYSDFLPLESRLQLSFERFGLSCAEPLEHTAPRMPGEATPYWHPTFWTVPEAPPRG